MNNRDTAAVGVRLEKTMETSLGDCSTPLEKYQLYEELAIAILDGEYMEYPEGVLEAYLLEYLEGKRLELKITLN
jgi:hypothetical protein